MDEITNMQLIKFTTDVTVSGTTYHSGQIYSLPSAAELVAGESYSAPNAASFVRSGQAVLATTASILQGSGAVAGNVAIFDANGNLVDSGFTPDGSGPVFSDRIKADTLTIQTNGAISVLPAQLASLPQTFNGRLITSDNGSYAMAVLPFPATGTTYVVTASIANSGLTNTWHFTMTQVSDGLCSYVAIDDPTTTGSRGSAAIVIWQGKLYFYVTGVSGIVDWTSTIALSAS